MNSEPLRQTLALAAMLVLVLWTASCGTAPTGNPAAPTQVAQSGPVAMATVDNLQAAFDGESNAAAKYAAFAVEADSKGFARTGSLFRAAGQAEEIHARNHADVIRKMGAEPKAVLKTPEVGSTAENLRKAIEGETYERDTMYPDFIRQARDAGNAAAVRTMNLARSAEAEHARLYQQALSELDNGASVATSYFVCPVCGFTTSGMEGMSKCPACFTEKERFIVVS